MDLLKSVSALLTPPVMDRISELFGVRADVAGKAVLAAGPAILSGLISKGSTERGAQGLLDLFKAHGIGGAETENVAALFMPGQAQEAAKNAGGALLGALFGPKTDHIARSISGFASMPADSVQKLLGLLGPIVAGVLAKSAPAGGFSPSSLMELLQSQKGTVAAAAPPGLAALLGDMPGLGGIGAAAQVPPPPAGQAPQKQGGGMLPWALLAAFAGIVLIGPKACSYLQSANKNAAPATSQAASAPGAVLPQKAPATISPAASDAAPAPKDTGAAAASSVASAPSPKPSAIAATPARLPANAVPAHYSRHSLAGRIEHFLKGRGGKAQTFRTPVFNFGSGSKEIASRGDETVKQIAAVLDAYPNAKVRFVGHTDSRGPRKFNRTLSEERAKAVADALVAAGVGADRVGSEGVGEASPVARNSMERGRRANRRVDVVVTRS